MHSKKLQGPTALLVIGLLLAGCSEELPASLDWRDRGGNFVTPPRDEGQCASCWAFAAVAMVESWSAIQSHQPNPTLDLSEQTLISCSHDGTCTRGGNLHDALSFLRDTGLPPETCFPYQGDHGTCSRCSDWQASGTKIPAWSWVDEEVADREQVKRALLRGPVTAWFRVHSDFRDYQGGVYRCQGEFLDNHFVLLIGWDDTAEVWFAKNNWGASWGEGGFFKIAYDVCGIGEWVAQVGTEAS